MSAKENAELAHELYERFNAGDLDGAVALANSDVEVTSASFGQKFQGPDGFMTFMRGFKDAFPDLQITITNQVADDNQVVNECTWTGTHRGPLQGPAGEIPATGKSVSGAQFCEVWQVRHGKLSSIVNYQDVSTWPRQLGVA